MNQDIDERIFRLISPHRKIQNQVEQDKARAIITGLPTIFFFFNQHDF